MQLYDYQVDHAMSLTESLLTYGVAKDASDTGTGKTVVACVVAENLDLSRVVVVCPKSVIPSWKRWLGQTAYKPDGPRPTSFVINYESLRTGNHACLVRKKKSFKWIAPRKTLIIFDEDHKCKGRLTLNARMLYAAKKGGYPVLLLGATSFSSPLEMDAIGYALGLHHGYRTFVEWLEKKCFCYKDRWGAWKHPKPARHKAVLEAIRNYIFPERGSRMLISDIPNFPANNIIIDTYEVKEPAVVAKAYVEVRKHWDALQDRKLADGDSALVEMLRARQEIELAKIPVLVELTKGDMHARMSVAIFVNFRGTQQALEEKLKAVDPHIVTVHGDQTVEERQRAIDDFQRNGAAILIATIGSGGVGISLHDELGGHPRSSLICPSFSAIELRQALGRIHRNGSKSVATQRIILASGTVEERVCAKLNTKMFAFDTINDTDLNPFT